MGRSEVEGGGADEGGGYVAAVGDGADAVAVVVVGVVGVSGELGDCCCGLEVGYWVGMMHREWFSEA